MRYEVLIALMMLALAGCATTATSAPRLNGARGQLAPAILSPNLSDDVTGGIQTRELNSVIRPGRY
jgi:hypothetical protein